MGVVSARTVLHRRFNLATTSVNSNARCEKEALQLHLQHVDGSEISVQAMQAPRGERELQETEHAVDAVVDRHHAAEVCGAKETSEDREVGRVEEEAPRAPDYQCHNLQMCIAKDRVRTAENCYDGGDL